MHDSLHHFEHAFDVVLQLLELALSQALADGSVVDGRLHSKYS